MVKNIAIIGGGDSQEYVISVKSAAEIIDFIDRNKYNPFPVMLKGTDWIVKLPDGTEVHADLQDFSIPVDGSRIRFDYAFIVIHGTPGENGILQSYLELQRIPYNTCRVLTSALTFNKFACKSYLKNFGIITPESILLKKDKDFSESLIENTVGLPCFVKPNNGGSSFGVSRVNKKDQLMTAVQNAFKEDGEVIIESYVEGIELSCGLVKTRKEELIFPVTEIISKNEFFDYEAKYTAGRSEEITPATVPDEIQKKCRELSSEIYDHLSCRGIVRIDYIFRGSQLYFLELNSVPGMTRESIVPKQIRAMGLKVQDVIDKVIEDTIS